MVFKFVKKILVVSITFSLTCYFLTFIIVDNPLQFSRQKEMPIVLMWSKYYDKNSETFLKLVRSGAQWDVDCCPESEVQITTDKTLVDKASAVVFFSFSGKLKRKSLPQIRKTDQLWILWLKEPPMLTSSLTSLNGLINWTMSYRRDSEIWAPYGKFLERLDQTSESNNNIIHFENGVTLDQWVKGKTKLLTGVASHCPTQSKRERVWKGLQNLSFPVDIYGACGKRICHRLNKSCNHAEFWANLSRDYKYYFAAENSLCYDYITEKFWMALEIGMVPLVYGGADYYKVAPHQSFMDTREFSSIDELSQFLSGLDRNPEEYKKYFGWRSKFTIRKDEAWSGWCDLCRDVVRYRKDGILPSPDQSREKYLDVMKWWNHQSDIIEKPACFKPTS